VFTPEERDALRTALLDRAHADSRVTGAALTGSAARGEEDRWSDVDLFLGIAGDADLAEVIADWTAAMYGEPRCVTHWDVRAGEALYRVFLLESCLQVDIAFTPETGFGARGPAFRVLFGQPADVPLAEPPTVGHIAGLSWLGVLHVHKAIERGRSWEAVHWIGVIHDQVLALARLPSEAEPGAYRLEQALVATLDASELRRALRVATECLLAEVGRHDAELATRLDKPLRALADG